MEEAHCLAYVMHSGSTKMYRTIKENYWWSSMKRDIAVYVSRCLVCQPVKVEHQKPPRTLQPLPIPKGVEHITMNFVVDLPRIQTDHNPIWMIVDRLLNWHIFWPFVVLYPWKDWSDYTSMRLSNCMEYWYQLC